MDTIITELKNKLLNWDGFNKYVLKNYTVIGICLTGSRLVGCIDKDSDFDLYIIVDEPNIFNAPNSYLIWNGHRIHWYYRSIDYLFEYPDKTLQLDIDPEWFSHYLSGIIGFKYLTLDNFILINDYDKCKYIIDNISKISNKEKILYYFSLNKNYLTIIYNNSTVDSLALQYVTKELYRIILAWFIYYEKDLKIQYLNKLKRLTTPNWTIHLTSCEIEWTITIIKDILKLLTEK